MKRFANYVLLVLFLFGTEAVSQAQEIWQNPKYGSGNPVGQPDGLTVEQAKAKADSAARMACLKRLSIYKEYFKVNNLKDAIIPWRQITFGDYIIDVDYNVPDKKLGFVQKTFQVTVDAGCPASTKNIYLDGVKIVRDLVEKNSKTAGALEKYVDTLMLLYDLRLKYFNEEGKVLGYKGIDLLRYKRNDDTDLKNGYEYLKKSIELEGKESQEAVLITYMQAGNTLFRSGKIDAATMVDNYVKVMDILDSRLKTEKEIEKVQKAVESVETIFSESGAGTCKDLIPISTKKFEQYPNDIAQLKRITKILDKADCTDSEIFAKAAEALYKLEPSAEAAYNLAKLFLKRESFDKCIEYYKNAIELEQNADNKAKYHFQVASVLFHTQKMVEARDNARKAIELKPNWGDPYLLIGKMYASSSKECPDNKNFESKAVYWFAVDQFQKGMSVDPQVATEANELISQFSQYYPDIETAFFHGVTNGQSYTIGCWIGESTSVRLRKR